MASTPTSNGSGEPSLLDKLDAVAPLAKLDAFPKVPSTYKTRSESRGFMTLFVAFLAFLLVLNDVGEFIWGWPDYEFSVDGSKSNYLNINLDMVVAMPCGFLSVDLRDAMGDRLYLSGGLRRDGTWFDVGQATALKEHAAQLSASQAVKQSRKSRGLFAWLFRRNKEQNLFKPTYKHKADGSACRITGTLVVKRVTANLHITTLGHGYASYEHVDHSQMNLSHIITEFSFGPHFPEIVQPLDNSFETTDQHFIAYQYFLHVVPTTYIAPRSAPLRTHQYSVTHYTREVQHDRGTPGIFFKFELDPLAITLHQRTTTLLQLLIRVVGVLGGVFVCMGYAIKVGARAVEVVAGKDEGGLVGAGVGESSGVKVGLRSKWGGGELRARKMVPQGSGWTMEGGGGGSPYSSYNGTPVTGTFTPSALTPQSPYLSAGAPGSPSLLPPGTPGSAVGLGYPQSTFGPPPTPGGMARASSLGPPPPRTPGYSPSHTPRSPSVGFSAQQAQGNGAYASPAPPPYSPLVPTHEAAAPTSAPGTPGAAYASFPSHGHSGSVDANASTNGAGANGVRVGPPPPRGGKKDD